MQLSHAVLGPGASIALQSTYTGDLAAQLYERMCASRGVSANSSILKRLTLLGTQSVSSRKVPNDPTPLCCLDFSGLSADDSFDIVLDLLLMSSSAEVSALDLSNMNLQNSHVEALVQTLWRCHNVRWVSIADNPNITDSAGELLPELLAQRRAKKSPILWLDISGTKISRTMERSIKAALPSNGSVLDTARHPVPPSIPTSARSRSNSIPTIPSSRSSVLTGSKEEEGKASIISSGRSVLWVSFNSLHRVLQILCWEPPLRTFTWFVLAMSLCYNGISVETTALAFVIIMWHRRSQEAARPPIAEGQITVGPSTQRDVYQPVQQFPASHSTSLLNWKASIKTSVLDLLTSSSEEDVEEGFRNAFTILGAVVDLLKGGRQRRPWLWLGGTILLGVSLLTVPFDLMACLFLLAVFLWVPVWGPLCKIACRNGRTIGSRVRLSSLVLLGKVSDVQQPAQSLKFVVTESERSSLPDNTLSDIFSSESASERGAGTHSYPNSSDTDEGSFVVTVESLQFDNQQSSPSEAFLPFDPIVEVSCGKNTWLSSQLSKSVVPYEWVKGRDSADSLPFRFRFQASNLDSATETITFKLYGVGIMARRTGETLVEKAKGHAFVPQRDLRRLVLRKIPDLPIKIRLLPTQQAPNLVRDLLATILEHEDADRQKYNLSLQQNVQPGEVVKDVVNANDVTPITLLARIRREEKGTPRSFRSESRHSRPPMVPTSRATSRATSVRPTPRGTSAIPSPPPRLSARGRSESSSHLVSQVPPLHLRT